MIDRTLLRVPLVLAAVLSGCRGGGGSEAAAAEAERGLPAEARANSGVVVAAEPDAGSPPYEGPIFTRVVTGEVHSCALTAAGHVYCWGGGAGGQLGDGGGEGRVALQPVRVDLSAPAAQLTAGRGHTCALADGAVVCWGVGRDGQTGRLAQLATAPGTIDLPGTATAVAAGDAFTCALLEDGSAWCWGRNRSGALGRGDQTSGPEPRRVAGRSPYVQLSAGAFHTCGVVEDGRLECWGGDDDGAYSGSWTAGAHARSPYPVEVRGSVRAVAAGAGSTCLITDDRRTLCWGQNTWGQAGIGRAGGPVASPAAVAGGHAFARVTGGVSHRCGITVEGQLLCWGLNGRGLGLLGVEVPETCEGTPAAPCATRPVPVLPDRRFRDIATSEFHSCAVEVDGRVLCWGDNDDGRLGTGTTRRSSAPVPIAAPAPPALGSTSVSAPTKTDGPTDAAEPAAQSVVNLHVAVEGGAALLLTDPAGRRAGLDPRTGLDTVDIPRAFHEGWEMTPTGAAPGEVDGPVHRVTVMDAAPGAYRVQVAAESSASYAVYAIVEGPGRSPSRTRVERASLEAGAAHQYQLVLAPGKAPVLTPLGR
jgi:alpha-tubulin suppressor-like RCC1 family protein